MFSGVAYRILIWVVLVAVTSFYVMRYGKRSASTHSPA